MKISAHKLVLIASVLFTCGANAAPTSAPNTVDLKKTSTGVRLIQEGVLVGTSMMSPDCPMGATCERTAVAHVAVKLTGCLNSAFATAHIEHTADRKLIVTVSAFEVLDSRSLTAMCIAIPTQVLQIPLYVAGGVDNDDVTLTFSQHLIQ